MGKRSVKSTKSGKFMNPTDQARKEARKKELKKNKKQRLLVRTSVLKNKDPGAIIEELDKLDEVEYNVNEPPQLAEKVLKDKRRKLKETLDRVMKLYQKEEPTYWNELKQIENDYERRRFHRIQFYESVKQAEAVSNVEDIPLPPTLDMDTSVPPPPPTSEEPKEKPHGILKSAPATIQGMPTQYLGPGGKEPPGVPPGPPPLLSSDSETSEDEDEEVPDTVPLPSTSSPLKEGQNSSAAKKSVRFDTVPSSSVMDEMDRFMKEVEEEFSSMKEEDLNPPGVDGENKPKVTPKPPGQPEGSVKVTPPEPPSAGATIAAGAAILNQPPPSMRPPYFTPGTRPYFPFPPPPLGGQMRMPPPPPPRLRFTNNRFSRPPLRHPPPPPHPPPPSTISTKGGESKIVSEAMIQAKPQIRSLSADVTRFVPVAVRTRRDDPSTTKEWKPTPPPPLMQPFHKPKSTNKDAAYEDFMKEMQDLL